MVIMQDKCRLCGEIVKANGFKRLNEERKTHFHLRHTKHWEEIEKMLSSNDIIDWKSIYEKYGDWWQR